MKVTAALITLTLAASAVAAQFPLRVDIDASKNTEKINIGAGADGEAKVEIVSVGVEIEKSSSQPWEHPVKAELYVIGKSIGMEGFTVVGVTKKEFNFTKENDYEIEFDSPKYRFGETSGNINLGLEYETYLVIVIDHEGKAVETRCGRSLDEKEMALIRTLEINSIYDKNLNIIGTVDKLNQATKNAVPAATAPGDDY
jgi:hypothetical protein